MSKSESTILYSFRRCPYAMRARLGVLSSGQRVELREVILRDKPSEMVAASPKATVPVLILPDGTVIDESYDVMRWALAQSDPEGMLEYSEETLAMMEALIAECDGQFKSSLDRYKYPDRYENINREQQRDQGVEFILKLDRQLKGKTYLFGERFSFADAAILPFIRQFAHVDRDWFWDGNWTNTIQWLEAFLVSDRFKSIMTKYPQWQAGNMGVAFGG